MSDATRQIEIQGLPLVYSGKVREVYALGDDLLVITTDRISAFDVVLNQGIPHKGAVLNCLSLFWFEKLADIVPNHLVTTDFSQFPQLSQDLDTLRGRTVLVRKLDMLPVEFVVRGYLYGSAWKAYQRDGAICGIRLPEGLTEGQKLEEVILTPTTKAQSGHDEAIAHQQASELIGEDTFQQAKATAVSIYTTASEYLATRGLTLCDTKFEIGRDADGRLVLGDEALTPDSSRLWVGTNIQRNPVPYNLDKQIARDYLETLDWDKTPPAPDLPDEVVEKVSAAYGEIFSRIVGRSIDEYVADVYDG